MLGTFEGNIADFNPDNRFAGDEKLPVQFRMDALKDDEASAAAGRPIYNDAEFIRIFVNKDSIVDVPVNDEHRQRWPRQYAAWKATGDGEPGSTGTRLEHWPVMTRAQVEEYRYFKVFTVEQLADLPEPVAQKIMGSVKLRQLARLAVEAAKGEAPFLKMQAELDKRDGEVAELKSEVSRLTKLIEAKLKVT